MLALGARCAGRQLVGEGFPPLNGSPGTAEVGSRPFRARRAAPARAPPPARLCLCATLRMRARRMHRRRARAAAAAKPPARFALPPHRLAASFA